MVCSPDRESHWTETEFLLRKIVNPICHGISIAILLVVAIIYFVLPSLRYPKETSIIVSENEHLNKPYEIYRDLVGNIITTITCCLIVGQVTNLMRIFTEFRNHMNFLILGFCLQISIKLEHE